MVVSRVVRVTLVLRLLYWIAGEVAAYAGRHWRRRVPAPVDR